MTSWYTITIVQHAEHPRHGEVASKPTELIGCTVLPTMAATILRGMADEIAPPKPKLPVMRSGDRRNGDD